MWSLGFVIWIILEHDTIAELICVGCFEISISAFVKHVQSIGIMRAFCLPWETCQNFQCWGTREIGCCLLWGISTQTDTMYIHIYLTLIFHLIKLGNHTRKIWVLHFIWCFSICLLLMCVCVCVCVWCVCVCVCVCVCLGYHHSSNSLIVTCGLGLMRYCCHALLVPMNGRVLKKSSKGHNKTGQKWLMTHRLLQFYRSRVLSISFLDSYFNTTGQYVQKTKN